MTGNERRVISQTDRKDVSDERTQTKPELPEKHIEVHEADAVSITVSHNQQTVPSVSVYRDDIPVGTKEKHITVTADEKTITIKIDQVEMGDAGTYKITAESSTGADVITIGVDVIGK